jgi:plasmid stabilization system protein ParE
MKVNFSQDSKEFIFKLKSHISKDNPAIAKSYTIKLVSRIRDMLQHPYICKINATFDNENIREIVLDGMKIIYKIYPNSIGIVMIYKYIDFDESNLAIE